MNFLEQTTKLISSEAKIMIEVSRPVIYKQIPDNPDNWKEVDIEATNAQPYFLKLIIEREDTVQTVTCTTTDYKSKVEKKKNE